MKQNRCITNLLKFIDLLQKNSTNDNFCDLGCHKPLLRPVTNSICYNSRPISIYNKNGEVFTVENDGVTYSRFRVENVSNDCVKLRALNYNASNNDYTSTNSYTTVNTKCICVVKCFSDTVFDNL